ncbi:acyltransferase [Novosphingobium sp. BL-8H]|uniref:acyltransferase family protein n=1 Tax=Novosphingobium sp. BL-8H TaxID=3127640 RepID=UPI00375716D8
MAESRTNYTVIQALRGIACLWVLLFHAAEGGHLKSLAPLSPFLFADGHLGVAIFFTLSGFVIAHSLIGRSPADIPIANGADFGRFLVRRSIRLAPAYWVSIALAIAFAGFSAMVRHQPHLMPTAGQIAAHVFYLQDLLKIAPINLAYWTLAYEIQFYVFLALMLLIRAKWTRAGWPLAPWPALAMWALALASALGQFGQDWSGVFVQHWGVFYLGVLARRAVDSEVARLACLILGAVLLATPGFDRTAALTAILLYLAMRSGWAQGGLNWRWLQFLGAISYSLYLVHNPLTGAAAFVGHRLFGDGPAADLICLVLILAVCIGGATLLWAAVERPSHWLSRRIRANPRTGTGAPLNPAAV